MAPVQTHCSSAPASSPASLLRHRQRLLACGFGFVLVACGGGGGGGGPPAPPPVTPPPAAAGHTLGGTLSGLTLDGLQLSNGSELISVAANATQFAFANPLASGTAYEVQVQRQPIGYQVACALGATAKGTMGAADISVPATCGRAAAYVHTLAGQLDRGYVDGPLGQAGFSMPHGLAVDASGLTVYVADTDNHQIRKITRDGVTSLAGSNTHYGYADGSGVNAMFHAPRGVAVDAAGNAYVADTDNNMIRKVSPTGVVTTLAGALVSGTSDGTGAAARFYAPWNLAIDPAGNLIVADTGNSLIRKVTPAGVVTTLAGSAGVYGHRDGPGATAIFNTAAAVAVDKAGNVYVADAYNHGVRKITPAGVVSTLAGGSEGHADGTGASASFSRPDGIGIDPAGNLYVVDTGNNLIRRVTPAGVVTTLAGNTLRKGQADGLGDSAGFDNPTCGAVNVYGEIFVCDGNMVRLIEPVLAP